MSLDTICTYDRFRWNMSKDIILMSKRGIGFMDIIEAMVNGGLLDTQRNTSTNHNNQEIFLVAYQGYVFVIPFVYEPLTNTFFLKTFFPSRKYLYLLHQ